MRSTLAKRTPTRITGTVIDPFFVEVTYDPRGIFKWHAVCFKTVTRKSGYAAYGKDRSEWIETDVTFNQQIDTKSAETRLGAVMWAKKVLRRERFLEAHPDTHTDKNFIIR